MISPEYLSIQANQISRASKFHRHVPLHIHVFRLRSAPHTVALLRRLRLFHWGLAQTISIASLA